MQTNPLRHIYGKLSVLSPDLPGNRKVSLQVFQNLQVKSITSQAAFLPRGIEIFFAQLDQKNPKNKTKQF